MHRGAFVGNLTRNPEVCYAPNGMASAVRRRCAKLASARGTPATDVCRIDVAAFAPKSKRFGASLHKGRGVLIEGRLQWRR